MTNDVFKILKAISDECSNPDYGMELYFLDQYGTLARTWAKELLTNGYVKFDVETDQLFITDKGREYIANYN